MTTKAKRIRAVKRYQGDSGMIYPNDCAPRRADAGYFIKQSGVPALPEQLAEDAIKSWARAYEKANRFPCSQATIDAQERNMIPHITYALKRAGITAGRKGK